MKSILLILSCLLLFSTISSITVSGNQSGTWTVGNSPYQIVGDVTVPTGSILTINPGVTIQAMGVWQIIAQGIIIANATATDSIRFVSGMMDQTTIWDGIRLENTTAQSEFSYCRIELGQYGIASVNSPVNITYCYFNKNQKGIQAFGVGVANPAFVVIDHNKIEYSQHNGILVAQNSNTIISYNEITNNGLSAQYYGAIQLSNQSAGGSNSPNIHHNHIHHNRKQGIIAWDVANAGAINPAVHHNLIENNLSGIYFRQCSGTIYQNTIQNNYITGNMNSGARLMISGALAAPLIAENIITGNYTGFYLTENANPIIGNPAINLPWAHGMNDISGNIDANSVTHSIVLTQYTSAALQIYAQNNFWDYETAAEIAGTITDNADDQALSTVIFDPWQNHVFPINLAGTVVCNTATLTSCVLQLIDNRTSEILQQWDVTSNAPFDLPVTTDSIVYIIAKGITAAGDTLYGAYGGTSSPLATQIIADVNFFVGEITLSSPPTWRYEKIFEPQPISGELCYPIYRGWFVYLEDILWVFPRGDYLIIRGVSYLDNNTLMTQVTMDEVIWKKVSNLHTGDSWDQFTGFEIGEFLTLHTKLARSFGDVTLQAAEVDLTYDAVFVYNADDTPHSAALHVSNHIFMSYTFSNNTIDHCLNYSSSVEIPDDTWYPLVAPTMWWIVSQTTAALQRPNFLGYTVGDSLSLHWLPPAPLNETSYVLNNYRLMLDNEFLMDVSPAVHNVTLPLLQDGLPHSYMVMINDLSGQYSIPSNIVSLIFTDTQDDVLPAAGMSVYPNPFSPVSHSALKVHYNFNNAKHTDVAIYNIKGQKVFSVSADKSSQELVWNGKDQSGKTCASGLYQIRLTNSAGAKFCKKVMLLH